MKKDINFYINELREMQQRAVVSVNADNDFAKTHDDSAPKGNLKISVSHSQSTFPVANAKYTVYDKNGNVAAKGITDSSGMSSEISLPAIPKGISEVPGTGYLNSAVFYDIEIIADGYIPITIKNIPIFEGITTLQNFDLTFFAASPNGAPQTITLPTENSL